MLTNVIVSVLHIKVFRCFEIIYTLQLVEPSIIFFHGINFLFLSLSSRMEKAILCKAAAHTPESNQYYVQHQLQMPALFAFHATARFLGRPKGKLPFMRRTHYYNGQSRSTPVTATGSSTTAAARIPTGSSPVHKHPRWRQLSRWQAVH